MEVHTASSAGVGEAVTEVSSAYENFSNFAMGKELTYGSPWFSTSSFVPYTVIKECNISRARRTIQQQVDLPPC